MEAPPTMTDWNKCEDFFRYTAGRFLFDAVDQMSRRSAKFDMNELARIASESIGSAPCVNIEKLPEFQYNKTFLLTMGDEAQVIAKVPNLNAGMAHYTTASEVATIDFLRTVLKIPAPKVYAWSSRATENPVGSEYIIMENVAGVSLDQKWPELSDEDKMCLVKEVVELEKIVTSLRFKAFGSLYYARDLNPAEYISRSVSYLNKSMGEVVDERFAIGPSTDRYTFDDGRGAVRFDRGPWKTAQEYITALALREITCIKKIIKHPRPPGIVNGRGCYHPTPEAKLSALDDYLAVAKYLLPDEDLISSTLLHHNLHAGIIFVHPKRPREIVSIMDWQSVHLRPLFLHVHRPPFISINGPQFEGFDVPLPETLEDLAAIERRREESLLEENELSKVYELLTSRDNDRAYKAGKERVSLAGKIICRVGNLLVDGEPQLNADLMRLEGEWNHFPRSGGLPRVPFPLEYSISDRTDVILEQAEWSNGMWLEVDVLSSLGEIRLGWQGWVKPEDYEILSYKLRCVREDFLDKFSRHERDRDQWKAVWPF